VGLIFICCLTTQIRFVSSLFHCLTYHSESSPCVCLLFQSNDLTLVLSAFVILSMSAKSATAVSASPPEPPGPPTAFDVRPDDTQLAPLPLISETNVSLKQWMYRDSLIYSTIKKTTCVPSIITIDDLIMLIVHYAGISMQQHKQ
jgi:hypothetical protein